MTSLLVIADILAWFGAFLFVSGGTKFYTVFTAIPQMVEINQWGLCFIPLALIYLKEPLKIKALTFSRVIDAVIAILDSKKLTWVICIFLAIFHFQAMYNRHLSFLSNWDLAIYANACANNLHSSLRNNLSLLADHFEPALALASPLCRVGDPAVVLLLTQAIAWLLGAWGIQKLATATYWRPRFSHAAQILYLLFAGNQTVSYYDFHLYGWSLATIPWILYAIQARKNIVLGLLIIFHLLLKENTSLFVAGLGIWLIFRGRRATGFLVSVVGMLAFVAIMKFAFPYFRGGIESEYFGKYYAYLGNNLSEVIVTAATKPWIPLQELLSWSRLRYFGTLLLPFLFFPLLSPSFLIPVTGALLTNALSHTDFMYSGQFHYDAEIHPWFYSSMIILVKDPVTITRWQKVIATTKVLQRQDPKILWFLMIGILFSGVTPTGRTSYYSVTKSHANLHVKLRELVPQLKNCHVAVVDRLVSHVADVPQLFTMDQVGTADAVIIAYPQGNKLWTITPDDIERDLVPKLNQTFKEYRPFSYDADFRIWTKEPCALQIK